MEPTINQINDELVKIKQTYTDILSAITPEIDKCLDSDINDVKKIINDLCVNVEDDNGDNLRCMVYGLIELDYKIDLLLKTMHNKMKDFAKYFSKIFTDNSSKTKHIEELFIASMKLDDYKEDALFLCKLLEKHEPKWGCKYSYAEMFKEWYW